MNYKLMKQYDIKIKKFNKKDLIAFSDYENHLYIV